MYCDRVEIFLLHALALLLAPASLLGLVFPEQALYADEYADEFAGTWRGKRA